ncbi:MAG: guanosine monophosphate reductase [bacterium]
MNDATWSTTTVTLPIQYPCFDDVLLECKFSTVRSRQDVDTSIDFLGRKLSLPVTNSNMDTIASPALSKVLAEYGTISSIHRFCSIEENVRLYRESVHSGIKPIVSIGVGDKELERARALHAERADIFMLDVAHAANIAVVEMYNKLVGTFPNVKFIVGNFGTDREVREFLNNTPNAPHAICVGIGGGSMCLTRVVTGVGIPTLASILDCAEICDQFGMKMMVNGGLRNSGDIVKALAAGADLIMLGSMFAGTDEASGKLCHMDEMHSGVCLCGSEPYCGKHKEYRGSASASSYEAQDKVATWRTPEGDSTWIPVKGPAVNVLNSINGGIRSAYSYLNAFNVNDLRANAKFNAVTTNTVRENQAHGK